MKENDVVALMGREEGGKDGKERESGEVGDARF